MAWQIHHDPGSWRQGVHKAAVRVSSAAQACRVLARHSHVECGQGAGARGCTCGIISLQRAGDALCHSQLHDCAQACASARDNVIQPRRAAYTCDVLHHRALSVLPRCPVCCDAAPRALHADVRADARGRPGQVPGQAVGHCPWFRRRRVHVQRGGSNGAAMPHSICRPHVRCVGHTRRQVHTRDQYSGCNGAP